MRNHYDAGLIRVLEFMVASLASGGIPAFSQQTFDDLHTLHSVYTDTLLRKLPVTGQQSADRLTQQKKGDRFIFLEQGLVSGFAVMGSWEPGFPGLD